MLTYLALPMSARSLLEPLWIPLTLLGLIILAAIFFDRSK